MQYAAGRTNNTTRRLESLAALPGETYGVPRVAPMWAGVMKVRPPFIIPHGRPLGNAVFHRGRNEQPL